MRFNACNNIVFEAFLSFYLTCLILDIWNNFSVVSHSLHLSFFIVSNLILYFLHIVLRIFSRKFVNENNYSFLKNTHCLFEIVSLGNAIVAALIFFGDTIFQNSQTIENFSTKSKYVGSLNLIRSMIMYRFIFLIFNFAASLYIDKVIFRGEKL